MADTRTIQELAQEAIQVQDACNLSGVVHSWSDSISRLRELLPGAGTAAINAHAISMLFADKCASLTGAVCDNPLLSEAYSACRALAEKK